MSKLMTKDNLLDVMENVDKLNLTILFAEDNEIVRDIVGNTLKEYFQKVYIVENGLEGREIVDKHFVDVVVTDINMPIESGLELIMYAKEKYSIIPIIITTAHSQFEMYQNFDNFKVLIKPYNVFDVMSCVTEMLDTIESHRKQKTTLDKLEEIYPEAQKILELIRVTQTPSKKKINSLKGL